MDLHYCSSALVHNLFHSLGEAIKKKEGKSKTFFLFQPLPQPWESRSWWEKINNSALTWVDKRKAWLRAHLILKHENIYIMTTQAQHLCLFVSYGAYVIISDTINRHRGQRCRGKQSSTAEFYKLWKLLLTKPQKHKTTQSSACSVYIERDKVFFTFLSSWMSKRLSNTPKKQRLCEQAEIMCMESVCWVSCGIEVLKEQLVRTPPTKISTKKQLNSHSE